MLWVITYILSNYGEIEDFSVEGIFEGTKEEVIAYVHKRNKEISLGQYDYCLAKKLN